MPRNNALNTGQLDDGQLLIGRTNDAPVVANITAGSGISITNGAGAITIAATGGGGTGRLLNVRYLTGSGTYTPTAGTVSCYVIACGAGGGGGQTSYWAGSASATLSATQSYGGAGGATGFKFYSDVSTIAGTSYSVGAGGSGGVGGVSATPSGTNPTAGGATTFADGDMHLLGGAAAITSVTFTKIQSYGVGSSASVESSVNFRKGAVADVSDNSDFVIPGGDAVLHEAYRYFYSDNSSGSVQFPFSSLINTSGGSYFGPGILATRITNTASFYQGISATSYGVGGSASYGPGQTSTAQNGANGGNGANGIIIVYEYGS